MAERLLEDAIQARPSARPAEMGASLYQALQQLAAAKMKRDWSMARAWMRQELAPAA